MSSTAALPQTRGAFLITDGGLETDLIFHHGFALPAFASLPLVDDAHGRAALRRYFDEYIGIARDNGVGIVLESPTWRGNPDWAPEFGVPDDELDGLNRRAMAFMDEVRASAGDLTHALVSGCLGPRGDGYVVGATMDVAQARDYHARQIRVLADEGADVVSAFTMTYPEEPIGIVLAAREAGVPVVISFTVETDGRLPNGQGLGEAIAQVDAATDAGAAYFMINCAHPTHFQDVLAEGGDWLGRIGGIRANASTKSHAELDEAEELDDGDPVQLAADHLRLHDLLPGVCVVGGCCGTDHRHVREVTSAWLAA